MRILAVADAPVLRDERILTDGFKNVDLILSCGDLPPEYLAQLARTLNAPLYYVRGNHDIRMRTKTPDGCTDINGRIVQFEGLKILGLEGSHWYNGGPFQYTQAQMRRTVRRLKPFIRVQGGVDIVITHAAPKDVHDGSDQCHLGFESFHWLINRFAPRYLIHGHIHLPYPEPCHRLTRVRKTKVVNCYGFYRFELLVNKNPAAQIKNFKEEQKFQEAFDFRQRGLRSVLLDKIVGSVGRYNDFDNKFRLKQHLPRERLERIIRSMRAGKPQTPVDLYQIKDEYFVLDGNHRIAAAKTLGFKEINARIVEFLPQKSSWENILYREKIDFHEKSGLTETIELTEIGQYGHLLQQIKIHRLFLQDREARGFTVEQAAVDWQATVYAPLSEIIRNGGLIKHFPQRTPADLYAYISYTQWSKMNEGQEGMPMEQLILQNMEAFRTKMAEKQNINYQEMMRELTAFVLLNVQTKKEQHIIEKLYALPEVKEVHSVHGNIDILVKIVLTRDLLSSDAEIIGQFVQEKVRQIPGIVSSQTLIPGVSKIKAD